MTRTPLLMAEILHPNRRFPPHSPTAIVSVLVSSGAALGSCPTRARELAVHVTEHREFPQAVLRLGRE